MPRAEYTLDEHWTLDAIERVAWIEFARRKAQQVQPEQVRALFELRDEIEAFFESRRPVWDEDASDGADLIFDAVQFGCDDIATDESKQQLLSEAFKRYYEQVHQVGTQTTYATGFMWSDFSTIVDLQDLHAWWLYINRTETRKSLGTEHGVFASIGKPRLEPDPEEIGSTAGVLTVNSVPFPTRVPKRVYRDGLEVTTTDQHDIRVGDTLLTNKLVLVLDLEKPIPTMRRIEATINSVHGLVRSRRNFDQLRQGIVPDSLLREREGVDIDPLLLHLMPTSELRIIKGYNSVAPLLRGLFAFDLVAAGMADSVACEAAARDFDCMPKSVKYSLKQVRKLVIEYEPDKLPW